MKIFYVVLFLLFFLPIKSQSAENQPVVIPTAEEQRFVDTVFHPTLTRIEKHYPLEGLRKIFSEILNKYRSGGSLTITNKKTDILASYQNEYGIIFYIPFVMIKYQRHSLEDFEDLIVLALLHENFHMENHSTMLSQIMFARNEKVRYENIFTVESEAWVYSFEKIIDPMVKNNRMKEMTTKLEKGYLAWLSADGDYDHPDWVAFIDLSCQHNKLLKGD